jgi:hypothetical protein
MSAFGAEEAAINNDPLYRIEADLIAAPVKKLRRAPRGIVRRCGSLSSRAAC